MTEPLALALKTASSARTPVLIEAEPGSGAKALAELIHAHTAPDPSAPLIVVRCRGTPESALHGELFGDDSELGRRAAAVERARGGTLFIDEIALLGLSSQAALAAIGERRHRSSESAGDPAFRLIAATSVDLRQRVGWRLFRQELLEQLGVIRIRLPPLRQRPDELIALARRCIDSHAAAAPGTPRPALSDEARDKLLRHRFPGNVDELRAVIERALILERSDVLSADSIRFDPPPVGVDDGAAEFINVHVSQALTERKRPPTLEEIERDYVIWLLREAGGNRTVVAKQMGVSYPTIMKKIADYKIDLQAFRPARSADR